MHWNVAANLTDLPVEEPARPLTPGNPSAPNRPISLCP